MLCFGYPHSALALAVTCSTKTPYSLHSVVGGALFHEPEVATAGSGLVIVRDVEFASTSESSLLPFYGKCHIGYMPSQGVVLGLSKVARLVTMFARRLQTQERFTQELLAAFEAEVLPQVPAQNPAPLMCPVWNQYLLNDWECNRD